MPEPNPTVRQRELAIRLRQLRTDRGMTVETVANQLLCSTPKISRIETSVRRPSLRDVRDLCHIYGLAQPETEELMALAREARQPGWWAQYDDVTPSSYIGLEQEATAITVFSMSVVPALLQTEEYARATISAKARTIAPAPLEQRVEALQRRQQILDRESPPRYRALIDEAVLHRQVGGTPVMERQLRKLAKLDESDLATIQIVPFSAGAHGITDSNFDFFEFGGNRPLPVTVYVEGFVSNLFLERISDIERYRQAIEDLRDVALIPRDSLALIGDILRLREQKD